MAPWRLAPEGLPQSTKWGLEEFSWAASIYHLVISTTKRRTVTLYPRLIMFVTPWAWGIHVCIFAAKMGFTQLKQRDSASSLWFFNSGRLDLIRTMASVPTDCVSFGPNPPLSMPQGCTTDWSWWQTSQGEYKFVGSRVVTVLMASCLSFYSCYLNNALIAKRQLFCLLSPHWLGHARVSSFIRHWFIGALC